MLATVINAALVLLGSVLGLLLKDRLSAALGAALTTALGLCVLGIGAAGAIGTENTLCVVVCMVLGTLLGEALRIESRLDGLGELLRRRLVKEGGSRFTEGFVNASVLFCVGAMAITGAFRAGLDGDYSILISKGVIDGVTSITFAAAMGIGVAFSVVPLLLYQGGLTLLAGWIAPFLGEAVKTEMSAVGGADHRGYRGEHAGPRQGQNPGGQHAARHLPAHGLPAAGAVDRRPDGSVRRAGPPKKKHGPFQQAENRKSGVQNRYK